jgi:mono/diheme cytochrome c family protein
MRGRYISWRDCVALALQRPQDILQQLRETPMIKKLIVLAAAVGVLGFAAFWFLTIPQIVPASALGAHTPDLANGKEMFTAGGCVSCHAVPKAEDKTRLGGGLAMPSPFGTFYAPNISPDPKDGIGAWTEAQFVTALNKGTSPGGEHYFPAFPYTSYQRIAFSDLRDLFAYLKTLPPVQGRVREHDVPFPFNIRRSLGGWKLLFLDGEPFKSDPSKSEQWNRGAYLVNGPGHCAECHSPRNILGGIITSLRFTGGPAPDGQGGVPNITQFKLKSWSEDDIASMLEDGMTPDADRVGGTMVDVIGNTSQLTPEDRKAMATYIKSLPAVEGRALKK